jgi:hypothetical protein
MLARVRGVLALGLAAGCGFSPSIVTADAPPIVVDIRMPDTPTLMITWAVDPLSGKGVPESAAKWTELITANHLLAPAAPQHLWEMQETSGSLNDSIGGATLSPYLGPGYDGAVSGWTRHAVTTSDTLANQGFGSSSIGDLDGTSYAMLMYVAIDTSPTSDRELAGIGANGDHRYVSLSPTQTFNAAGSGGLVTVNGTIPTTTAVHPVLMEIAVSHSTYVIYTDEEKLEPTWRSTSGAGSLLNVGNATIGAAAAHYLYGAVWSGAGSEFTDGDAKKLLQSLGWTVTGY